MSKPEDLAWLGACTEWMNKFGIRKVQFESGTEITLSVPDELEESDDEEVIEFDLEGEDPSEDDPEAEEREVQGETIYEDPYDDPDLWPDGKVPKFKKDSS